MSTDAGVACLGKLVAFWLSAAAVLNCELSAFCAQGEEGQDILPSDGYTPVVMKGRVYGGIIDGEHSTERPRSPPTPPPRRSVPSIPISRDVLHMAKKLQISGIEEQSAQSQWKADISHKHESANAFPVPMPRKHSILARQTSTLPPTKQSRYFKMDAGDAVSTTATLVRKTARQTVSPRPPLPASVVERDTGAAAEAVSDGDAAAKGAAAAATGYLELSDPHAAAAVDVRRRHDFIRSETVAAEETVAPVSQTWQRLRRPRRPPPPRPTALAQSAGAIKQESLLSRPENHHRNSLPILERLKKRFFSNKRTVD